MSVQTVVQAVRAAEAEAGRETGSVQLVAVTKGHSPDEIREKILSAGAFALAENRGQELRDKKLALPGQEWHFIGPLQRNKIKYLEGVSLVHTIEEAWQAEALAEAGAKWGHAPDVLVQLHNGETQKHGVLAAELPELCRQVRATGLRLRGLMVMAPYGDPAGAERIFRDTAQRAHDLGLAELSMGMSDDFPQAIAAGATLVRVGRSLFT